MYKTMKKISYIGVSALICSMLLATFYCQSVFAGIAPPPPAIPGAPEINPSVLSFVGTALTFFGYKFWTAKNK